MLPSKYEVLAGHDFSCFLVSKSHGKSIKSGAFGARGPDFQDIGRIFEGSDFQWIFDRQKVWPKSVQMATSRRKGLPKTKFAEGSAAEAASRRGFWSLRISAELRM